MKVAVTLVCVFMLATMALASHVDLGGDFHDGSTLVVVKSETKQDIVNLFNDLGIYGVEPVYENGVWSHSQTMTKEQWLLLEEWCIEKSHGIETFEY